MSNDRPPHLFFRSSGAARERDSELRIAREVAKIIAAQTPPEPPPVPPTIWAHGSMTYSRDKVTLMRVTEEADNLLQSFLDTEQAMQTPELEKRSDLTNISRAMGNLVEWENGLFADAIRTPNGGKNRGGYYIRVRTANK